MRKRPFGVSVFAGSALLLTCAVSRSGRPKAGRPAGRRARRARRDVRVRPRRPVSHDGGRPAQARRCRHRRDRRGARQGRRRPARGRQARPVKKVKPLKLRIGYLDIIGGIESADRAHNSLRVAFKKLGATWLYCDGQGTPTKWVTCGNSLLAQNIDVLALTGIDPSTIPSVVQAAKAKNVPIVDFGGTVGPGYAAQFAPNEGKNGKILAAYLKAKLASQSGVSNIVSIDYPAPWAQQRTAQLKSMVAANSSKMKISRHGDHRPDQPDRRHAEDRQRRADRGPERQGDLGLLRHRRPGGRSGRGEQVRRQDVPQQAVGGHVPRRPELAGADAQRRHRRRRRQQLRRDGVGAGRRHGPALRTRQGVPELRDELQVSGHR